MAVAKEKETKTKKTVAKKTATKTVSKETYSDMVEITEADMYVFGEGNHYQIYKKLGAHPCTNGTTKGTYFAVWAPHAQSVSVVGEFNGWNEDAHYMDKLGEIGIYGKFVPGAHVGELYKFLIRTNDGRKLYKADPFANQAEFRPGTASIITDLNHYEWGDAAWMAKREKMDVYASPIAVYECHIGSFMKHPDGTEDGYYTYREFADRIVSYLKEMKYTHVELMGIAEYPFDGSWGYQVTGYYAPTSRYGTPEDFRYLIDTLHKNNIGVILDWVPAHFPKDAHGLADFDGEPLFEYPDPRMGEHPDWGTKVFNFAKNEVRNFLIANALFWINEFHVDGLRVDAVASMLYLDYGRQDGQWIPNKYGGNENLDAIEFFKHLNSVVHGGCKGVMTIAEESTAWPKVTHAPEDGGLGFTFKWNMGWMHDFCDYMKLDPYFRKNNHHKLTFAMSYNSSEHYIMPLSHDEVVHLKCSMVNKMPGYQVDKYANLRVGYTYMFGHAGKKLLFMGQEFAQEREWSEARELDWFLLSEPLNKGMQEYVKELLKMYNKYSCLYEFDSDWRGFEWLNANDGDRSTYTFYRKNSAYKDNLLFVLNMTPMEWTDYRLPLPNKTKYKLILNSNDAKFGGSGLAAQKTITAQAVPCADKPYSATITLPPYAALVYSFSE